MPVARLRQLAGRERTKKSDHRLALLLALVAGGTDAGGFLATGSFTSHMSGNLSTLAMTAVTSDVKLLVQVFCALLAFLAGAACTAILVNWGRRSDRQSMYATPLLAETILLTGFGVLGRRWGMHVQSAEPEAFLILCFAMGLQNAMITKLSRSVIRTTHVTGMITDAGIELGKLFYRNVRKAAPGIEPVIADREKLVVLSSLVAAFMAGGLIGASGYLHWGTMYMLPLAGVTGMLAVVPIVDDLRSRKRDVTAGQHQR